MKTYKQITGYSQSIINLDFNVQDSINGFVLAGGLAETGVNYTGFISTGFLISGFDGYLFDQSGRFFGGYSADTPFNIQLHLKTGSGWSYYHNGCLIANQMNLNSEVEYLEFTRSDAAAGASVQGQPDQAQLVDFLMYTGHALFFSGGLLVY